MRRGFGPSHAVTDCAKCLAEGLLAKRDLEKEKMKSELNAAYKLWVHRIVPLSLKLRFAAGSIEMTRLSILPESAATTNVTPVEEAYNPIRSEIRALEDDLARLELRYQQDCSKWVLPPRFGVVQTRPNGLGRQDALAVQIENLESLRQNEVNSLAAERDTLKECMVRASSSLL